MSNKQKRISLTRVVSISIAALAMTSKALAAVVAPIVPAQSTEDPAIWSNVRGKLQETEPRSQLNPDLVDYVRRAASVYDIEAAVRLSYSMVSPSEVEQLDKLWIDTLIRKGGSDEISAYMVVRSKIDDLSLHQTESYLDRYVWKVSNSGDS